MGVQVVADQRQAPRPGGSAVKRAQVLSGVEMTGDPMARFQFFQLHVLLPA